MKFKLLIFILTCLSTGSLMANCNWNSRNGSLYVKDSCLGNVYFIETGISFNGMFSGKYKCEWKLDTVKVGSNSSVQKISISQNGTYTICVKVTDTINNCDTVYCRNLVVNCISNCNWKARNAQYFAYDTCDGTNARKSVNGYIWFPNAACNTYQWSVNNVVMNGSQNAFSHTITKNGTYNICLKVTDTCNKCDTTFCKSVVVNCFKSCNWKSRNAQVYAWDSCQSSVKKINAEIALPNASCYKYEWKVNNVLLGVSGSRLSYNISQNGAYTICVKVTDTCLNCDTTYCISRYVNCVGVCNWKSRNGNLYLKDSCRGTVNFIEAGVSFNGMFSGKYKCYWSLNGVGFGNRSAVQKMPVFQNGNYIVCVKVEDTVNFCDTTFCAHIEVDCITECLWSQRGIQMYRNDSCKGVNNRKSMNVYLDIDHKGCKSYRWKVNGVVQTESRPYLSYTLSKDTSYQVCVEISDTCLDCDTVICSTYTTNCFGNAVSNADVSIIQVYPNPVNDILQVKTDVQLKVSILNLLGVEVLSKELQEGVNTLSVQSLSPGIYLLKTETKDGHSATRRLIIE